MLRDEVWKKSITAASSQAGAFDTSTTTWAPSSASCQSLAGERVDARVGRRRKRVVARLAQLLDELRADEAGPADDNDLHLVSFRCRIRLAPLGSAGGLR